MENEGEAAPVRIKEDGNITVDSHNFTLPAQRKLIDAVLVEPGMTLEEDIYRHNNSIRAVMRYCAIEEDGMHPYQAM